MAAPPLRACVFDAYGTIFDLGSALRTRRPELGNQADSIARTWRVKQLEYAWVHSLIGRHADFWTCTARALDHALAVHGAADEDRRERLLDAYRTLLPFPEAPAALRALRGAGVRTLILSNGTPTMLEDALRSAGLADLFDACLSIEEAGIYKPAPDAYALAVRHLALAREEIAFVSSNGWDVAGAAAFGFAAIRVNRENLPDEYDVGTAAFAAADLADAARWVTERG